MTKRLIKTVIILAAILTVGLMVTDDINSRGESELDYVYVRADNEIINIFKSSDALYYLFLPSYIDEDDAEYSNAAKDLNINVLKSESLDTVFINTQSGSLDDIYADKEYSETAKIRIYSPIGELLYDGGIKSFKGRGNYSWNNWDKKPFSLTLSKDGDRLLDLGSGGKYALIANASDATFLRNEIGRSLDVAAGVEFSHTGRFVDLYINGDYMGNYYLADTPDIGSDRIDVTDAQTEIKKIYQNTNMDSLEYVITDNYKGIAASVNPDEMTGGYLLEREFEGRYKLEYDRTPSSLITRKGESFFVRSPKYCSTEQMEYLSNYMNTIESAIYDDSDEYTGLLDIESFAKRYLVEEVMKNYDAGVSSAYFYKDSDEVDSRLKAAPGWDYDMSLGNYLDWMEYYNEGASQLTYLAVASSHSDWWKELYSHDDFEAMVKKYYADCVSEYLNTLTESKIDEYQKKLSSSAAMDAIRWKDMYDSNGYNPTDKAEFDKLKDFILARHDYLDSVWITE